MSREQTISRLKASQPQLSIGTLTTEDQAAAIQTLVDGDIPLLHVDIMDGIIWPKTTVGPDFVASLDTDLLKDVHLLIDKPEEHIAAYAEAGAGIISFSRRPSSKACLTRWQSSANGSLTSSSLLMAR